MNLAKIHQLMLRKKEFPISLPHEGFKDQAELAKILFYFIVIYFILFLAALGLCCSMQVFSSCGTRGYSSLKHVGFSL